MPRPKEFDPDEALERAMALFWRQGYEATSIRALVRHLGINRFSLYSTFGGKRELFFQALDRYRQREVLPRLRALESEGLPGIRAYFADTVDYLVGGDGGDA